MRNKEAIPLVMLHGMGSGELLLSLIIMLGKIVIRFTVLLGTKHLQEKNMKIRI